MLCRGRWPIGVCSWSLKNNLTALNSLKNEAGLTSLHIDLGPILDDIDALFANKAKDAGWDFAASMVAFPQEDYTTLETIKRTGGIVPDDCWAYNQQRVKKAIELTCSLGIQYLEFHFGFLSSEISSTQAKLVERVTELCDCAKAKGVTLLMESGQETAQELKDFLLSVGHQALAINFDPGNMLLYGKGSPLNALNLLSPWIRNIHAKDAIPSAVAGQWGTEVPWGDGHVEVAAFIADLEAVKYSGSLCIEREAGNSREEDILLAANRLSRA